MSKNIFEDATVEIPELRGFLKVGLPGNRARDQADLQERIRAFELVPITGKLIIGIYRIR
jgi:hypothetical protein